MRPIKLKDGVIRLDYKSVLILLLLVLTTNFLTYRLSDRQSAATAILHSKPNELYLLEKATPYVYNIDAFEQKVREISEKLAVPPEWLMAVMHSESRFDASVKNIKGSGATGLIQFMPTTAKDFDITVEKLRNMNHIEQLDFVYKYLNLMRKKYQEYENLTQLYLAILYPKAIPEGFCYTMYAKPSVAYKMNAGLDKDKDGRVTVQDIDTHLKRIYPTAYMVAKEEVSKSFYTKILEPFRGS
ncbi:MAG: transglycosylase SLT domain-containing protein [Chitinophagales bacterium]